jgi:hypothetical protein
VVGERIRSTEGSATAMPSDVKEPPMLPPQSRAQSPESGLVKVDATLMIWLGSVLHGGEIDCEPEQ